MFQQNVFDNVFEKLNDGFKQIEIGGKITRYIEMNPETKAIIKNMGEKLGFVEGGCLWGANFVESGRCDMGEVIFHNDIFEKEER